MVLPSPYNLDDFELRIRYNYSFDSSSVGGTIFLTPFRVFTKSSTCSTFLFYKTGAILP